MQQPQQPQQARHYAHKQGQRQVQQQNARHSVSSEAPLLQNAYSGRTENYEELKSLESLILRQARCAYTHVYRYNILCEFEIITYLVDLPFTPPEDGTRVPEGTAAMLIVHLGEGKP
ncbi:Nn.00g019600.m01.CDS01 [Neocucurbitaria sp. VM-36]